MKYTKALLVIALLAVIGSNVSIVITGGGSDTPVKNPWGKDPGKGGAITQDYG